MWMRDDSVCYARINCTISLDFNQLTCEVFNSFVLVLELTSPENNFLDLLYSGSPSHSHWTSNLYERAKPLISHKAKECLKLYQTMNCIKWVSLKELEPVQH